MNAPVDPNDTARYTLHYRNPVMAHLGAQRLYLHHTSGGLEAVRAQLAKLRARSMI